MSNDSVGTTKEWFKSYDELLKYIGIFQNTVEEVLIMKQKEKNQSKLVDFFYARIQKRRRLICEKNQI